jgi:CHASE2 domain-containing sensor protein
VLFRSLTTLLRQRWWWFASLLVGVLVSGLGFTQRLDWVVYDLMAPRVDKATRSLVVAVDEASLAALGRWPWPRDVQARLLERLQAANVSAVGYAVLFSEPSADPRQEARLAHALQALPATVLAVAPVMRPPSPGSAAGGVAELRPLDMLVDAARLGHVDMEVDADGAVRRLYLRGGVANPRYPALSAALLDSPLPPGRLSDRQPDASQQGSWVRDDEVMLPRMLRPVPVWSFIDALSSPAFLAAARDRVVWVGVTAAGLGPEMVSPLFDSRSPMPAVLLHAQAYEALAAGAQIVPL